MGALDWDAVRYFLAARRAGSFAGAARTLGVKHTTVSRRVAELERLLGAVLFRRTPDGLLPTAAGDAAGPLAEEMERAARQLSAQGDRGAAAPVRLALAEAFSAFVLQSLGALRTSHPDLRVELLVSDARADLTRDEADLALRLGPLDTPSLVCSRLARLGWSLYASPAYVKGRGRLPWTKLDGHDVIGFEAALSHAPGARWLEANVAPSQVVLRCSSLLAARDGAVAGLGVAALPCFLGGGSPGLVRVTPEVIGGRDAYLVVHRDRQHSPRVRAVVNHLRRLFASHRADLQG